MNPDDFVDAINVAVLEAAATSTMSVLEDPPGRRPPASLVQLSNWYRALGADDQTNIGLVAKAVAHAATFNFLAVLDGVKVIEPAGPKGRLRLVYESPAGEQVILNAEEGEDLHDILNAIALPCST